VACGNYPACKHTEKIIDGVSGENSESDNSQERFESKTLGEIDGKNVFADVTEYVTVPWEEAKYETHHNYTDIQYMISGSETMTYARIDELTEKVPYDEEKDVVFYGNENPGLKVVVKAGEYMIFKPWDGHKPRVAVSEPAMIKKVIIKIKEN
jgi:YhcH/YjgK/YiaL family protein